MAARLIGAPAARRRARAPRDLGDLILTSRLIDGVVAVLDPTVVYVHSRNDSNHDHRAVHEATLRAVRAVPQVYAYQSPSSTPAFNPTKLVPIDDVVTAKADLLRLCQGKEGRSNVQADLVVERRPPLGPPAPCPHPVRRAVRDHPRLRPRRHLTGRSQTRDHLPTCEPTADGTRWLAIR